MTNAIDIVRALNSIFIQDRPARRRPVVHILEGGGPVRANRLFTSFPGNGSSALSTLAILLGCGLQRREVAELDVARLQRREDHWRLSI
jgi:hypothetical protein